MKVIHVMTNNTEGVYDLNDTILAKTAAFLSVLKWKSLGFTTKIYVDKYFKELYSKTGLLDLYDEVDDTFFVENNPYETYNISKHYFWAFSKLFVYLNESEPFIMADMDFIPLQDFHPFLDNSFIYYKEHLNEYSYPNKTQLACAPDYEYPEWFTWKERPINAAIVYLKEPELKELYIQEAIRYAQNNTSEYEIDINTFRQADVIPRMVFAEQRILPECATYLNIQLNEIKNNYELIINPREIHLFIYKQADDDSWAMFFLDKLNQEFPEIYSKVINLEEFSEMKEKIDSKGFVYTTPKMLKRANW